MKSTIKQNLNPISVANQAICWVKYNPCCCCGLEHSCGVKYKGTCPVFIKLKTAFSNIKELIE